MLDLLAKEHVQSIVLLMPSWQSYSRSDLGRVSNANHLRSLTIRSCRGSEATTFHSIAQLLSALPALQELGLRDLALPRKSIVTLPRPIFKLDALAMIGMDKIRSPELCWLLRSTAVAESLKRLALEWNQSPKALNEVRYTVLRTVEFYLWTNTERVAESFVLHFPNLQHYAVNTRVATNATRLVRNVDSPSLKHLTIRLSKRKTLASLVNILATKDERLLSFPDKVTLASSLDGNDATTNALLRLAASICQEQRRIDCKIWDEDTRAEHLWLPHWCVLSAY